jgi:hypothetical protein
MMGRLRKTMSKFGRVSFPAAFQMLDKRRAALGERRHWDQRIADVIGSPDNARLRRVADAGKIQEGYQIMHNGLKVVVDGYYGDGITRMLIANRGCHEPQEEVVFEAIIQTLPEGAVMVEAGAYWGFYAMWFCQVIQNAKVFLIEPSEENLAIGQRNFRKNRFYGDFSRAYVGTKPQEHPDGARIVTIESFLQEKGLARVNLLHADVQGHELEMLQGARSLLESRDVDYLFLSTHTMELHVECAEFLDKKGYRVLVSVDLEESHSLDGLLVACSPQVTPPPFAPPSKKPKRHSPQFE